MKEKTFVRSVANQKPEIIKNEEARAHLEQGKSQ
jgi:hypothetical protein